MTDYLKDPDFMDPACVAAWEELVDELERADMSAVDAERTWSEISGIWCSRGCSSGW